MLGLPDRLFQLNTFRAVTCQGFTGISRQQLDFLGIYQPSPYCAALTLVGISPVGMREFSPCSVEERDISSLKHPFLSSFYLHPRPARGKQGSWMSTGNLTTLQQERPAQLLLLYS